jgi:two-component system alkaline phosphatase synthesis response regulator PhoP
MKTILLVDDDPLIVKIYRGPLEKSGYRVEVAEDGLAAMKVAVQLRPDVVVLDVMMPKVDGPYVFKYIRSQPGLKGTKIIVLSTATLADAAKTTLEQNPDRTFLKSEVTPKIILQAVNELLGAAGQAGPPP